ncbi:MAG: flagellar hook-basal body complex protein FliE [Planctomycetota bacterium]|nr:flagellar hook-basal body complex protein FliE [Planctomycetota bacterium]
MVNGVGGGLGRAAIEAALKQMRERAGAAGVSPVEPQRAEGVSFADTLREGVQSVDASIKATENLPLQVAQGNLDFHEVAAQLKESELSFEFAMQVRNKLIDAYREVMRMSV